MMEDQNQELEQEQSQPEQEPAEDTVPESDRLAEQKSPAAETARQPAEKPAVTGLKSIPWKKIGHIISAVLPILLLLVAVTVVVHYIVFGSKGEFHSDCTDTIYWAKASHDSGHMLNEDFDYACLLPFGTSLLMQLFMPLFGLSMTTQTLGMLMFLGLFTGFFCLMVHELGWNYRWTCYGATILLLLLNSSKKLREIFWDHTIYYSLSILFLFIGMFLLFRLSNLTAKRKELETSGGDIKKVRIHQWVTLAVLLLFFMLTCTDGISAISIFALPFMAGIFLERLMDSKTKLLAKRNRWTCGLLVALAVMLFLGMKLNAFWAGDIVAGYEGAYSNYVAQSEWLANAQKFPLAWLTLLGVEDIAGKNMMEADSIKNLLRMMVGILLIVLPIAATVCYPKYQGAHGHKMRILIWSHWASTALVMVGYICGLLSAANWRLSPVVGTSMVISLAFLQWAIHDRTPMMRLSGILLIPMALVCALNTVTVFQMPRDSYKKNTKYELVDFLEDEGLNYGYATFWYANAMTVISNSDVLVRSVSVSDTGEVTPYYYQTERSWYKAQEGQDNYFLLLTQGEFDSMTQSANALLTTASRTLEIQDSNNATYHVLVFDQNIF